jgi:hypothetical protein
MMRAFEPNDKEYEALVAFEKHHHKTCPARAAFGGSIEVKFAVTSRGVVTSVVCIICGEEKNVTDWSRWQCARSSTDDRPVLSSEKLA